MKFLSANRTTEEKPPQDAKPAEDAPTETMTSEGEQPDDASETEDVDVMTSAFEAVAQVVRHEMDSVKRSLSELEARMLRRFQADRENTNAAIADLRKDMIARIEEVKSGMEDTTEVRAQQLEQELESLTRDLNGVQEDLDRQISTAGRVATLLNGMAGVFSDPKALPEEPGQHAYPASESPER